MHRPPFSPFAFGVRANCAPIDARELDSSSRRRPPAARKVPGQAAWNARVERLGVCGYGFFSGALRGWRFHRSGALCGPGGSARTEALSNDRAGRHEGT